MAFVPYFGISPNTVLSLIGLIKGPDKTVATPVEDWEKAKVDVVIPTLNEERNISLCLASLERQTMKPDRIIIIDDGSKDKTVEYAQSFAEISNMDIQVIKRKKPIGKTPSVKRQSRESDADVEFILDGDTVLESTNYIERTVRELYQAVGIGSACGTILPLRAKDRNDMLELPLMKKFVKENPGADVYPKKGIWHRLTKFISNNYRDALYMFLQKFVYRGQMTFFGSITNPVGCAVAYRRKYVKNLFDKYEPILGDDLTNSEDIFIGFALVNKGYRNIQLNDVYARSLEPAATRLPKQVYNWSSSFLQSCYYFNGLMKSPFKVIKRKWHEWRVGKEEREAIKEKREISEPYRQPFGEKYTLKYGRPAGWAIFWGAFEKIAFPTALLIMVILQMWEMLLLTLAIETSLSVGVLLFVSRSPMNSRFEKDSYRGLNYFMKGVLLTPIRYLSVMNELVTVSIFLSHLWISKQRRWRK